MKIVLILIVISYYRVHSKTIQSCDSLVYCQGKLLDVVQNSRIFSDSKTFVDMIQINTPNITLKNFESLMTAVDNNPSIAQIQQFIIENFVFEGELETWFPCDYKNDPKFLRKIDDIVVRDFARTLVSIWPNLGRKVKDKVNLNPDMHSLIYVPQGFIIPGGRFRELYYWDTYWVIKGLLICEMNITVRGMLDNFMFLVKKFGFVPNGSRVYYLNRSQPPLLSLMVGLYVDATGDLEWLRNNIDTLEEELLFWLTHKTVVVEKDGVNYTMAHYASESGTPRPEAYYEDVRTCATFTNEIEKENCYQNLKSAAESGWDFSSRWIFESENNNNPYLTKIQTRRIIPVDLNSYLCKAFEELSRFYNLIGKETKAVIWKENYLTWKKAIEMVFYDRDDGIWYDYDTVLSQPRKMFFPSNFAPLWTESYDTSLRNYYGQRAASYFNDKEINNYKGGIPTSLEQTGEQWDLPNAWPPLQDTVILGLKKSGEENAGKIAKTLAKRWIVANIRGYQKNKAMFEKYDAIVSGQYGHGGEYNVQEGFGWTNGVALSIINEFYIKTN